MPDSVKDSWNQFIHPSQIRKLFVFFLRGSKKGCKRYSRNTDVNINVNIVRRINFTGESVCRMQNRILNLSNEGCWKYNL